MRRGFTLVELLVIVGIMGAMVTASVVSVRSGQGAARIRGATRDIYAVIRHARSTALVTQQPAIITYSTVEEDGEVSAVIEINSTKVLDTSSETDDPQTLTGAPVGAEGDYRETARELAHNRSRRGKSGGNAKKADPPPPPPRRKTPAAEGSEDASKGDGQTIEDVLFAPISSDVVRGVRLKVLKEDEAVSSIDAAKQKSKLSVFSNVDYLIGKFQNSQEKKKAEAQGKKDAKDKSKDGKSASLEEQQEPVSIVWEVNGRVEPHRVWIYSDGAKPEDGLCVKIDRFGATKVLAKGERDE